MIGGRCIEIYDVVLIPLIIGLVELLKRYGLKKKMLPIMAMLFGVVAGVMYVYPTNWKAGILIGLMMGLSASGLYSGGKTVVQNK